jgi:signal transduction histidine kinase
MSFVALSALLVGITLTILWIYLLSQAGRDALRLTTHRLYALCACVWCYFTFAVAVTNSPEMALLYGRLLMASAIMLPILLFHSTLNLLRLTRRLRVLVRAGYVLSGVFLIADCTPLFVSHVRPAMPFRYWPQAGPVYLGYVVFTSIYAGAAIALMIAASRQTKGRQGIQYRHLAIATLASWSGGYTTFPLWFGTEVSPNGMILVAIGAVIEAYTFMQSRHLDFTAMMEKSLTFLFLMLLVAAPTLIILLAAQRAYFGQVNGRFSMVVLALFTLVLVMDFRLKREVSRAITQILFRARLHSGAMQSEFSKTIVMILDLPTLSHKIVRTLAHAMGTRTAALYLLDKGQGRYRLASGQEPAPEKAEKLNLKPADPLPTHLKQHRSIIVRQEVNGPVPENLATPGVASPLLETLDMLNAEACIPLLNKDRLIGFCTLGVRAKGSRYSKKDLTLLTALAHSAAPALGNATLYEDLRRSQELMRRADQLRSLETVAGGFAHDIRNPLTCIKTFVQLAAELKDDPEFIGHFTSVAAQSVCRIEGLAHEMLDYATLRESQLCPEDLNTVVASCFSLMKAKASSRSVKIEQDLAPDLPPVSIDLPRIRQVLLNLFLNSLEAMEGRGGRLTVKTEHLVRSAGDECVRIDVTDSGRGIPAEDLDRIFVPFFTTKPRDSEQAGVGLGLTMVQQIVQDHRGSIEVESTVGIGTTVFITLPAGLVSQMRPGKEEQRDPLYPAGRS